MTISDVMTTPVTTVPPMLAATKAWQLMNRQGIHHLVVIDGGRIVGIVSERDGVAVIGALLLADSSVSDVMSTNVTSIAPTASIGEAASLMRRRAVGCLPVVAGGRLVGIVTRSDLLDVIALSSDGHGPRKRGGRISGGRRRSAVH